MVDWVVDWFDERLVGWLVDWLVGWLIHCLVDWLMGWLIAWLIDGLVEWWLSGCSVDWLIVDRPVERLVDWLLSSPQTTTIAISDATADFVRDGSINPNC